MSFRILSVAENGGDSESITAVQEQHSWGANTLVWHDEFRFKIDLKRNVTIQVARDGRLQNTIQFADLDLKAFAQFIEDVKIFHDEEDVIAKLRGNSGK